MTIARHEFADGGEPIFICDYGIPRQRIRMLILPASVSGHGLQELKAAFSAWSSQPCRWADLLTVAGEGAEIVLADEPIGHPDAEHCAA